VQTNMFMKPTPPPLKLFLPRGRRRTRAVSVQGAGSCGISACISFKNFNFRNPHPEMRHWISCGIGRDASEMRRTL